MEDYEKLGVFYIGKIYDPEKTLEQREPLLYESKDLTTHAVCVGMTGSGKTGLGIGILEEAAIDGIPSIIIDPKGDLGNLLLAFNGQTAKEFMPWADKAEAEQKGMSVNDYAAHLAKTWKSGLSQWGQGLDRINRFNAAVDLSIYTPASNAGIPLSILSSFEAPSEELRLDTGAVRERVLSITSSLLGLVGINADPIKSREHILISAIVDRAWREGIDLDLASLIYKVQTPPFSKIGALDLDTFISSKDRSNLAAALNGLLASPGFHAWMEGESLDIQRLLYTGEGKPRVSILSIAHLSDAERMFFVTLFLNQLISWVRKQPGTSSLRALFYMDEIFGYFPPTAMPPSKIPMLTLLKQARAYGLGIVLCTQNPVDLDYKGLSNCGTWFIGKLQTKRDKERVVEGLSIASNGEIDAPAIDKLLALVGKRIFIMRSIHEKDPVLFETRWTLSYLRGPLTLAQMASLKKPHVSEAAIAASLKSSVPVKPAVPSHLKEYFFRSAQAHQYLPMVAGFAKLHYVQPKSKIDAWEQVIVVAPINSEGIVNWSKGELVPMLEQHLSPAPNPGSSFGDLPSALIQEKKYPQLTKTLSQYLYQEHTYKLLRYGKLVSNPGETEGEFRIRVSMDLREMRDQKIADLQEKYGKKIDVLSDRLRRFEDKVEEQEQQAGIQKAQTYINIGTGIFGALFGRRVTRGTVTQAGTSMRGWGRMQKEQQYIARAKASYAEVQQQLEEVKRELDNELASLALLDPGNLVFDRVEVRPRKSDIIIEKIAVLWKPAG